MAMFNGYVKFPEGTLCVKEIYISGPYDMNVCMNIHMYTNQQRQHGPLSWNGNANACKVSCFLWLVLTPQGALDTSSSPSNHLAMGYLFVNIKKKHKQSRNAIKIATRLQVDGCLPCFKLKQPQSSCSKRRPKRPQLLWCSLHGVHQWSGPSVAMGSQINQEYKPYDILWPWSVWLVWLSWYMIV